MVHGYKYTPTDDYEMPICDDDFKSFIEKISSKKFDRATVAFFNKSVCEKKFKISDYEDEVQRDRYLKAHMVANIIGCIPPGFRNIVKAIRFKDQTDAEKIATRDRQLIDLHYLYCNYRYALRLRSDDSTVDFLRQERRTFDLPDAMEFISIQGRRWVKAEKMLGISENIQLELNYFHSNKIRKKIRDIETRIQEIGTVISEYAASSKSRLSDAKLIEIQSNLRPLLLANGDTSLAVKLRMGILGLDHGVVADRSSHSRSIHESKRWLKGKGIKY